MTTPTEMIDGAISKAASDQSAISSGVLAAGVMLAAKIQDKYRKPADEALQVAVNLVKDAVELIDSGELHGAKVKTSAAVWAKCLGSTDQQAHLANHLFEAIERKMAARRTGNSR
jgi:hypothetical protein